MVSLQSIKKFYGNDLVDPSDFDAYEFGIVNGIFTICHDKQLCEKCGDNASLNCPNAHSYLQYLCKYDMKCKNNNCKYYHTKPK